MLKVPPFPPHYFQLLRHISVKDHTRAGPVAQRPGGDETTGSREPPTQCRRGAEHGEGSARKEPSMPTQIPTHLNQASGPSQNQTGKRQRQVLGKRPEHCTECGQTCLSFRLCIDLTKFIYHTTKLTWEEIQGWGRSERRQILGFHPMLTS